MCSIIDLSKKIKLMPHEWSLCLGVGEYIPEEYEDILIQNIDRVSTKGIVLSWALESEKGFGYVNCRSNDYIKEKIISLGYSNDKHLESDLRSIASLSFFKDTIMVFRKEDNSEEI